MPRSKWHFVIAHQHIGQFLRCRPVAIEFLKRSLGNHNQCIQNTVHAFEKLHSTLNHFGVAAFFLGVLHARCDVVRAHEGAHGQGQCR